MGYVYTIDLIIPVELQATFVNPSVSSATLLSYSSSNYTISLSKSNLTSASILLSRLRTPPSTAPITVTVNVSNSGVRMFYGSGSIIMTALRAPATLSVIQSNQVVYQSFTASITISGLTVGDTIQLSTLFNNYFYNSNQANCSTAIVSCNSGGSLTVNSINNNGSMTTFQVVLVNQAYVGSY